MGSAILDVIGLSFKNPTQASKPYLLKGIDFKLKNHQVFGVMGPSGSGKTTLLKCLCRLLEPSGGKIYLQGEDIYSFSPALLRQKVCLVFQKPTLIGHTVMENFALALKLKGDEVSQGTMIEYLKMLGLSADLLTQDVRNLSHGEAQRVCLARSLLLKPTILLLDEPTASLDEKSKSLIEELLVTLIKQQMTVILSTHDEGQRDRLVNEGIRLNRGEIAATL